MRAIVEDFGLILLLLASVAIVVAWMLLGGWCLGLSRGLCFLSPSGLWFLGFGGVLWVVSPTPNLSEPLVKSLTVMKCLFKCSFDT